MRAFIPGILLGWATALLFAFSLHLEEPACVIGLDRMNVFYCGVDNPVSILVRGVPEAEVRIEASGVTIKKDGNMHYAVRASTPGEGSITISGGKLQPVTFKYRVKRTPDPEVLLGAAHWGRNISSGEFKAQGGLAAVMSGFDVCGNCEMVSYKVSRLRNGQLLAEAINNRARYEAAAQAIINAAQPGDTYIFDEVKTRCPGDIAARALAGLTFVIK